MRRALAILFLVTFLGVTAACGSDDDEAAPADTGTGTGAAEAADPCSKDQLNLVSPGSLTIGTDNPAFPPWFQDDEGNPWDPTTPPTKLGYEAATPFMGWIERDGANVSPMVLVDESAELETVGFGRRADGTNV